MEHHITIFSQILKLISKTKFMELAGHYQFGQPLRNEHFFHRNDGSKIILINHLFCHAINMNEYRSA